MGMSSTLATATIAALFVVACSDGPSKSNLKDGLEQHFREHRVEACWNIENGANVSWPIRIENAGMDSRQLAILDGLRRSGIVKIGSEPMTAGGFNLPGTVFIIDMTQKDKDAKAWDTKTGFCVGHAEVKDVTEFTEPGKNGDNISDVIFTWQYEDVPSWVDRDSFPKLAGIAQPVSDEALLKKTNNGWRVQ